MNGSGSLQHIDAVDAFARTLFLRTQQHPSHSLSSISLAVRQLHLALRHLRIEAADPDSLLNKGPDSAVYARQVPPIVQDCDFALKQLETVLDLYDAPESHYGNTFADKAEAVRSRLEHEKMTLDMLLDTVQLHSPLNKSSGSLHSGNEASLERIKDKVDHVASKLLPHQDKCGTVGDEDRLWREFSSALEKEGFSPRVLHEHKEVLRAYIRELESASTTNGGSCPSVRGLLESQAQGARPPPVPPKELLSPSHVDDKSLSSIKNQRLHSGSANGVSSQSLSRSYTSDDAPLHGDSMALISTKDLIAMDSLQSSMAGMHLNPVAQNHDSSPRSSQKHLMTLPPHLYAPSHLTQSLSLGSSPVAGHHPSLQSSVAPHLSSYNSSPALMPSRLAPDRYGKDIPMEATWTKIKRSLVSSEVLARAGVRYEARPGYVAVLGRLTREQIADFARQSAECRAARSRGHAPRRHEERHSRPRADSKSSRDDDDDNDSALWNESDTTDYDDDKTSEKGARNYPFIVSPPSKNKTSPSSTVMPKPILKNKNENHVRFDPEPHEVEPKSPRSFKDDRDRYGDSRRPRDARERDDYRRNHNDYRRNGERYGEHRHGGERDRYGGDRHHGFDGDHHRQHRDRRGDRRDERSTKKKAWGETLGAVGIGGAAASLIGVLAQAAVGI